MSDLARAVRPARIARVARVMRVDARRWSLLVALPVLAGLGAVAGWRALPVGFHDWDGTVRAAEASVRWAGPAAAALAAWTGVRGRRLDYLRALAARSPAAAPLHDLALLVAVALLAHLAGWALLAGPVLREGGFGAAQAAGVAAGSTATALVVVAGYLAGRIWPHTLVVAAAAAAAWAWGAFRPSDAWALLPPARLAPVDPFEDLLPGVPAAQAGWAAGLAVALVLGYTAWITRRPRLLVPVGLALGGVLGCTAWLEAAGGTVTAPSTPEYVCREWPVSVCVHPALRDALPTLGAAVAPLATRLAGTPGAIRRIEQIPGREPMRVGRGVVGFHLADLTPGYERRAVREIGAALGGCAAGASTGYQEQVVSWLLDEPMPARPITPFAHWAESQRREWFARNYRFFRACELSRAHFM
ncbi:hypothetical protein LO762_19515 [Actinocorallia sp. API 0066]|uniref:hypothetical protein n=1 Tax=Actinocorallia sp. API 0066 TaxID=2896846 RepID=UPI001E4044F8|nr:hypothetical protein [Actinocorallia sp. API 0066]MCD0451371.1 hypothetical protein [Actinocorallia sp. API 0066]